MLILALPLLAAGSQPWALLIQPPALQVLPDISRVADPSMRSMQLLPLCERFAGDVSRWVQLAALQTLGPFIATLDADEVPHSEHSISDGFRPSAPARLLALG